MGAGFSKRFLLLVLIPALVLASATGLRLWVTKVLLSYDRIRFDVELPFDPADELPSAFVAAAYGYGVSLMLLSVVAVFAAAFALWLMMQAELPGGRVALGLSLLVSALALVIIVATWGQFDLIETDKLFAPSVDLLPSNLTEVSVGEIVRIVVSTNRVVMFPTVILLVFAAASCLSVPFDAEPLGPRDLARRMAWLRAILYLGAGLLIAGLIAIRALIDLPGALFPPSAIPPAIADFSNAVQLYLGSTMTFLLVAIYIPPAMILRAEALELARHKRDLGEIEDPRLWLREQRLIGKALGSVYQVAAILGPLLAGPLASFLAPLVNRAAGS